MTSSRLAMGDPQAPLAKVKAVLAHNKLLAGDRLSGKLLSIGDHFDWGRVRDRDEAAKDGEEFLSWLASHDPEQVVILAGNHDLARVGELLGVTDAQFDKLQQLADKHYWAGEVDDEDERVFFRSCSFLPSTEIVARDFSTYKESQQTLVKKLLLDKRMVLAHAENGLLFTHAGVTRKALARLGVDDEGDETAAAAALNRCLNENVDRCLRGPKEIPLVLPGVHRPADGIGEGDGILYHRPTFVEKDQWLEPRRFDPRRLPHGMWQVVGHVRDKRCVSSLLRWSEPKQHAEGVVRHLISHKGEVVYRHGPPPPRSEVPKDASVMIFIDGAMADCPAEKYQLLDVAAV